MLARCHRWIKEKRWISCQSHSGSRGESSLVLRGGFQDVKNQLCCTRDVVHNLPYQPYSFVYYGRNNDLLLVG
jgi:hypothetical protein